MNEIDEVKARLDIVDIVSSTVTLRKSGKNYSGFCPFHSNTKTPSFVVFPETQTWRCFGACAEGGDIFSFVMKRDGADFKDVLEDLARQAGVQLRAPSPQSEEEDKQRQKLLELNAAAADYFHKLLTAAPEGAQTRKYLATRELTSDTIALFQLGYAKDEWEALKRHFLDRGYTTDELLAAGLIVERDDGSPGYDRFRNRLIIPIRDARGRVIGFGARALAADQMPKYLNSPQSVLFDKSATLYGLDLAKKHIRQVDRVVIVEGYMDVIQAHQHGAQNVVAQMGTALTEQQLKILKRTTGNFVLALDADTAGNSATLRGINIAREALDRETVPVPTARGLIRYESRLNADIRIATLPPGKDPDDILKDGLEAWQKIIDAAVPVIDFYFQTVTRNLDLNTAKDKSAAVHNLIPVLRDIGDPVEQQHYIQKLARLIQVDERTLIAEMKRQPKQPVPRRKPTVMPPVSLAQQPASPATTAPKFNNTLADSGLETYCLSLVVAHPPALAAANDILEQQQMDGLGVNDFNRGSNKDIFRAMQLWTAADNPQVSTLVDMVGESLAGQLLSLANFWQNRPPIPTETIYKDLSIAILRLRLHNVGEQIKELRFLQREAVENNNFESARHYTAKVKEYSQYRKKLEHTRDALSITGKRRTEAVL
ncbi:MAG: DNA primase [Chloroflexi bacterium]|nr:MAG: DNA primase [Chloroflexota bacterium]